jgi:hypothetical protein
LTWARTAALNVRSEPRSTAEAGMMLCLVPPTNCPTVSTAVSYAATSRETRFCIPSRMLAAAVIGSIDRCG